MNKNIYIQCDMWDINSLEMVQEELKSICDERNCPSYWFKKCQQKESKDPLASSEIMIDTENEGISFFGITSGYRSTDDASSNDIETFIHVPPEVFCALVKTFKDLYNHKINIKQ